MGRPSRFTLHGPVLSPSPSPDGEGLGSEAEVVTRLAMLTDFGALC